VRDGFGTTALVEDDQWHPTHGNVFASRPSFPLKKGKGVECHPEETSFADV
jgi:hypothetical protein